MESPEEMCAWLSYRPKYSHKVKCIVSEWCQSIVPFGRHCQNLMEMHYFFVIFFHQQIRFANGMTPDPLIGPNSSSKVRMAQFLRAFRRAPLSKDRAVARARAVLQKVEVERVNPLSPGAAIQKMTKMTYKA